MDITQFFSCIKAFSLIGQRKDNEITLLLKRQYTFRSFTIVQLENRRKGLLPRIAGPRAGNCSYSESRFNTKRDVCTKRSKYDLAHLTGDLTAHLTSTRDAGHFPREISLSLLLSLSLSLRYADIGEPEIVFGAKHMSAIPYLSSRETAPPRFG